MDNKNTGLGSSLLLGQNRNNERPAEQEPPQPKPDKPSNVPDVSDAPPIESRNPTTAAPRRRCTLYIDEDVDEQLDLTSRVEGKQRSEIVTEILRAHLPQYEIRRGE